jgi:hypothetical protein
MNQLSKLPLKAISRVPSTYSVGNKALKKNFLSCKMFFDGMGLDCGDFDHT